MMFQNLLMNLRNILKKASPLLILCFFGCSSSHLLYESISDDRIRVFVNDDLGSIKDEDITDDAVNRRLQKKAIDRAKLIIRAQSSLAGFSDDQIESYFLEHENKIKVEKKFEHQTGDTIEVVFDLYFDDLQEFFDNP